MLSCKHFVPIFHYPQPHPLLDFKGSLERTPPTHQSSKHLYDLFTISLFCLNIFPLELEANQWKDALWVEMNEVGRNITVMYLSNE